ncbi:MAG: restriction endonuclease subunit S [Fibrobacter sp.]|nr:restriction endonuclease subunit S [Fibrobacter sp.]
MRKMKDSGIVRLGLMPEKWIASRVKYIYSAIGSGTTPSSGNSQYYDGSENWIQSGDLYKTKYVIKTEKTVTDFAVSTISALHKYKADFVIIAMYGASIGNVAISKIDACVNQACCVIKPNSKMDFNYLYYTLVNDKDIMLDMSIGGTQPNISQAKILELPVFLPPIDEQKKIADFLDEKCGEIDSIRSDIQKQIDILNDYKKSVITEAVTKGLNPKAKLKDSGIEWIGKIPEHWDCRPIKYGFKLISGSTPKSDNMDFWDGDVIWITPADYKTEDKYVCQGKRNISYQGFLSCSTNIVPKGSLIFSKRAPIGTVAINSVPLCTNQGCLSCVPKACSSSLYFYFVFIVYEEVFNLLGSGTTFKEISATTFSNVKLPYPSINEQKNIAAYLDEKCSAIDATIADKQKQLETLDEYKKSLIFEYVTGKKEVLA